MAFNEDSSASGHDEPWIQWFCGLKGHEMFCEVERSYIEDGFNLYGLRACVSNFSDCLDLILDRIGPDDSDDSHLTQSACTLYGLIHARYIITAHGLDAMYNKYAAKEFGTCPLVQCSGQPVLPVGLKDEMGADTVKIFCCKCKQVYHPPPVRGRLGQAAGVDGAAFGTTFPHLFLMTFSNLVPDPLPLESTYIPRVFGFRVHKTNVLLSAAADSPVRPSMAPALLDSPSKKESQQPPTIADGGGGGSEAPGTTLATGGVAAGNDVDRNSQLHMAAAPDIHNNADEGNKALAAAAAAAAPALTVLAAGTRSTASMAIVGAPLAKRSRKDDKDSNSANNNGTFMLADVKRRRRNPGAT